MAKKIKKSGKQRRAELQAKKKARDKKRRAEQSVVKKRKQSAQVARWERDGVAVNAANLAPSGSYSVPKFVERGYYEDIDFQCHDCGKEQIWTGQQQKWWYEVAKGDVATSAIRCRECRRKERERRNEARRVHLEGVAKKKAGRK